MYSFYLCNKSLSIFIKRLYLQIRSPRDIEPVLIKGIESPTAKSAIKVKEKIYWNSVLIYAEDIHGNLIQMTTDHIVPKSLGGTNQRTNLQTMCEICNHSKQNYNNIDYNKYYYNGETNEFYSVI